MLIDDTPEGNRRTKVLIRIVRPVRIELQLIVVEVEVRTVRLKALAVPVFVSSLSESLRAKSS